jgi:hypothetical protein
MSAIGPKQTSLIAPHMSAFGGKADIRPSGTRESPRTYTKNCAQVQISGYGVIPCCIILIKPIREIEGGKEIQEGKARSPGAQEEGDEEGEVGQESKG